MIISRVLLKRLPGSMAGIAAVTMTTVFPGAAQDLEPRRWSHLPVGTSVIGAGYAYTNADIAFDPVLLIEDASMDLHAVGFKYVHAFEERWAEVCGRSYGISVSSGTAALETAVHALGIPAGTEFILPSFTMISSLAAVLRNDLGEEGAMRVKLALAFGPQAGEDPILVVS